MIYLVSRNQELFSNDLFKNISVKESIDILKSWNLCQYDSETSGRDAHICNILSMQFGSIDKSIQIVVDCTTISPLEYKEELERMLLIGQNIKFDLEFLYKYEIIPLRVYDTMIVEQVLYLGFPFLKLYPIEYEEGNYDFPYIEVKDKNDIILYQLSFSLKALELKYLHKEMDKTVRGEIIWRGLDDKVIEYAANDVVDLYDIMLIQLRVCNEKGCYNGIRLECEYIPAIAYMEWCGIKLDEVKWKAKMNTDRINYNKSIKNLNDYIASNPKTKQFTYIDYQGDLFTGYDTTLKSSIDWGSSKQVTKVAKLLGFNTTVIDKKSGEEKDSVIEKQLITQKGIDDTFLDLYFKHQEYHKVVTSFGQGHLNAINPITGRIHTSFKQLGTISGRLSSGSTQINTDLAKLKGLPIKPSDKQKREGLACSYPNLQQLPSDEITRSSFVSEKGNKFISCDFSAEESRLGADIYKDKEFLKEFLERSGDTHNMFAWIVFRKECIECGCKSAADVKALAPKWRKKVKGVEFAYMFGAAAPTIAKSANCTVEEAQSYIDMLDKEFVGVSSFAKKGSQFVRKNGYILINPLTGTKLYWWDFNKWLSIQNSFTREFWDDYKINHKGTGDSIALLVRKQFKIAGNYDRLARNVVTQGTGAIILKKASIMLFNYIVSNNYFNKIKLCVEVHDEINCEFPEELTDFPSILKKIMEDAAAIYCKSLPIPADAEVSDHWVH